MNHPVLTAIAAIDAALDEAAGVNPAFMTTTEKQAALVGTARVRARLDALGLRVLAVADDVAEVTGARSTAAWLADETRDAHGTVRRQVALAKELDTTWAQVQAAFAAGRVNLAQVRVITEALDALPADLGAERLSKAERLILDEADHLSLRELRTYGARLLEFLAPDIADQAEYQRLLEAERRAVAATRLSLRSRGDGTSEGSFRIPDHATGMLRTFLAAFTAPRRGHLQDTSTDEFASLPLERKQGIGFVALLERVLTSDLPRHGGKATTVAVTIDHDRLVADVTAAGIAHLSTGTTITAGQARRLACQAGILPVVLGGQSQVLDLGRTAASSAPPSAWRWTCATRAAPPWAAPCPPRSAKPTTSSPGHEAATRTSPTASLLCSFHHHRAHDPGWEATYHPNGTTTFHRRQ